MVMGSSCAQFSLPWIISGNSYLKYSFMETPVLRHVAMRVWYTADAAAIL